jgi:hypothetical protein
MSAKINGVTVRRGRKGARRRAREGAPPPRRWPRARGGGSRRRGRPGQARRVRQRARAARRPGDSAPAAAVPVPGTPAPRCRRRTARPSSPAQAKVSAARTLAWCERATRAGSTCSTHPGGGRGSGAGGGSRGSSRRLQRSSNRSLMRVLGRGSRRAACCSRRRARKALTLRTVRLRPVSAATSSSERSVQREQREEEPIDRRKLRPGAPPPPPAPRATCVHRRRRIRDERADPLQCLGRERGPGPASTLGPERVAAEVDGSAGRASCSNGMPSRALVAIEPAEDRRKTSCTRSSSGTALGRCARTRRAPEARSAAHGLRRLPVAAPCSVQARLGRPRHLRKHWAGSSHPRPENDGALLAVTRAAAGLLLSPRGRPGLLRRVGDAPRFRRSPSSRRSGRGIRRQGSGSRARRCLQRVAVQPVVALLRDASA